MQNNGNKLRAFIITFIIMSILIGVGYYLYTKMSQENNTKGDSITKKFTSLFGISKKQSVDQITDINLPNNTNTDMGSGTAQTATNQDDQGNTDNQTTPQGTNTNNQSQIKTPGLNPFPYSGSGSSYSSGGYGTGSGFSGGSGFTGGGFTGGGSGYTGGGGYTWGDITPTKTQCNDGLDNDGDGKKDIADPGCHTDSKATNISSYFAGWDDESSETSFTQEDIKTKNKCELTLLFNEEDKKRIDELSRLFYKIAPYLATQEDIDLEVANQKTYAGVISKAKEYTAQCYKERTNLGPSRALANGKDYMLESRQTEYANTSKLTPSESFLPGDKGVSFYTPYVTVTPNFRNKYFQDFNGDLVINKFVVKVKDRGGAAGTLAAHILQNMHDFGIVKKYIPGKVGIPIPPEAANYQNASAIAAYKGDENYEKVLNILLRETGAYLDTLAPGRQEWSDRQGGDKLDTFTGFVSVDNADYWGYVQTKLQLNIYLRSGDNDNMRKVDYGSITWAGIQAEYEQTLRNDYLEFEKAFNVK